MKLNRPFIHEVTQFNNSNVRLSEWFRRDWEEFFGVRSEKRIRRPPPRLLQRGCGERERGCCRHTTNQPLLEKDGMRGREVKWMRMRGDEPNNSHINAPTSFSSSSQTKFIAELSVKNHCLWLNELQMDLLLHGILQSKCCLQTAAAATANCKKQGGKKGNICAANTSLHMDGGGGVCAATLKNVSSGEKQLSNAEQHVGNCARCI